MPIMSSLYPLLHFPSKENDRELESEKEKKSVRGSTKYFHMIRHRHR